MRSSKEYSYILKFSFVLSEQIHVGVEKENLNFKYYGWEIICGSRFTQFCTWSIYIACKFDLQSILDENLWQVYYMDIYCAKIEN